MPHSTSPPTSDKDERARLTVAAEAADYGATRPTGDNGFHDDVPGFDAELNEDGTLGYSDAARLIARYSACGMLGALCYSTSTAVTLAQVGTQLGSNAQVVLGVALSLLAVAFIGPQIGICQALQVRTSRAISLDPSGQRAALIALRGLMFTIPTAAMTCALAAFALAPALIPLLWRGEIHASNLDVGGGLHPHAVLPGMRAFNAEVRGMTATQQIVYAIAYSVPGCLLAAVAWTVEFATLFEPETAALANAAALAATYVGARLLVPHGLWAACLVPCITFVVLFAGVVLLTARRHPQWAKVFFSLGVARRPSLAPVLHWPHFRSFGSFAARSVLWQIGNVSNSELAVVVVGPMLAHADVAAFNIINTLVFVMWSIDEGILEGVGTVLSMQVAATRAAKGAPTPKARHGEGPWRVLAVGGATSVAVTASVAIAVAANAHTVAACFTREVNVETAFATAMAPLVLLRTGAALHELWAAAVKTIERSEVASVSTIAGTVGVVIGGVWATQTFGPRVEVVLWWWAGVQGAQVAYAAVVSMFIHWRAAFAHAANLAPTESDDDDEDDDAMAVSAA